jgi:colanic acid/amylovoran biosynthesis glycosyltransferase
MTRGLGPLRAGKSPNAKGLRVAIIVGRFPSLTQTFILNQITGLLDRGADVDIYAWQTEPAQKHPVQIAQYDLLARTRYLPLASENLLGRFARSMWDLAAGLATAPRASLRSLNMLRFGKSAASLMLLREMRFLRSTRDYDIIHCHFGPEGLMGAMLRQIGALRGAKLLTTFYGFDLTASIQQHGPHYYDPLFASADLLLPLCNSFHQRLLDLGAPREKVQVHHIGVDVTSLPFVPRKLRGDGKVHFISVGRLVEKKGFELAVLAFARLARQRRDFTYTIVGDGAGIQHLQRMIKKHDLAGRVRLLGALPHGQVMEHMLESDIIVAPSIRGGNGDEEGTPTVLIEAHATGMPAVATRHSGIPEIVEDGVSGLLVPERDVDALAGALAQMMDNPARWPMMGAAARSRIQSGFDIEKLNDRLLETYFNLLGESPWRLAKAG